MEAITDTEFRQFAPKAADEYVAAFVHGWADLQKAGITTPLRLCEFLAQAAHECGGFTIVAENLNYTAKRMCEVWPSRFKGAADPRALVCANNPAKLAEAVYGGRLGNVEKGDGYRYRGRGIFQDTGRDCYREYGAIIGQDLEDQPELLERPSISLRCALARWQKMGLNRFADRHYTRAIGNAINRGNPYSSQDPIGRSSRMEWFLRAWAVFGNDGAVSVEPGMALGAYGSKVRTLQERLRELGYGVGSVDSVFGPSTARAVAAFKLDHKRRTGQELEPDEVVGPLTDAALDQGEVAEISSERAETSEHDLAAMGSTEVTAGQRQAIAGRVAAAGAAVEGARQYGIIDSAKDMLGDLPTAQSVLVPVIDAIKWGFSNAFWVAALLGGVWVWARGRDVIKARLEAHRNGSNLWR